MLENEDVLGIAKSIASRGFFLHERMIVRQEGRLYYVVEGNRRLSAMKLLVNPELALTKRQVSMYRRLSEAANLQSIEKLDVVIVDDRQTAAGLLADLHIGYAKKPWTALQQARFYRELVEDGLTVEEISEETGKSASEMREYLRSEQLYRVALTLDYPSDTRAKVESVNFPLTTLDRFIESKTARRSLGISIDEIGNLEGTVNLDRFRAVLKRVTSDIVTEKNFTRRVNKDEDFRTYFEEIESDIDVAQEAGTFSLATLIPENKEAKPSEVPASPSPAPRRRNRVNKSIVPRGFSCTSRSDRVRAVFNELKAMPIAHRRNSTGVMLRVLLDIGLWNFLVEQKLDQQAVNHFDPQYKKRKNNNKDWTPPLRDLISYVCEQRLLPGVNGDGYKALRMLVSRDKTDVLTIDGFNQFAHNRFVTPTESELREVWSRATPMLEVILNDQQPNEEQ
ncbi:hypothetical protein [Salinisphaera japonica]|uniref:ParB/Sulfiredoxin domain-containing protein n=1 Tax=Salinisphaera japonica YTM-1 TaxID=1209778 RepID=A0A423PVJ9_9GAMM|nr:hypothetical protein SAJA_06130 [Salinisphaera japonica YTM-1]